MSARPRPPARNGLAIVAIVVMASFGVLLFAAPSAAAITYVRGEITVDTVWGSLDTVYVLTGNTIVRPGVSLTILPGTEVRMDPDVALFIEGFLSANGNPGNEITFTPNNTASVFGPVGIRFNASSDGSVSWATFDRFSGPLYADNSSPDFQDNTISSATIGIRIRRSSSFVLGNTVNRATIGILIEESDAQVFGNTVNGTSPFGIEAATSGTSFIAGNTVTNVSGFLFLPAIGIYAVGGASPFIQGNTVDGVQGVRGANGLFAGTNGTAGGFAVGILVDGASIASVDSNIVTRVAGGRGGDGAPGALGGPGGHGGMGGDAAGIVAANAADASITFNTITTIAGGRGGAGGGGGGTARGGNGAAGASAAGAYILTASVSSFALSNWIEGVTGGSGGNGGDGVGSDGNGGSAGDSFGFFAAGAAAIEMSGNTVQSIRGGWAGNSTAAGGDGLGGAGGDGNGLFGLGIAGSALFHFNTVYSVLGGAGGRGAMGGAGGNGTALGAIGYDDGLFNATGASGNWLELATGGAGGAGDKAGGNGGGGGGLVVALVSATTTGNSILTVSGGAGGNAADLSDGGRGGDAAGYLAYTVGASTSTLDFISTVTKGAAGAGPPVQARYARGFFAAGNATAPTALTIENATIEGIGDFDLWVDNYTDVTTINTPFAIPVNVESASSTLTVRNYLRVEAYWPDGFTLVPGTRFVVMDDGATAYDVTSASGAESWLLVTDRVYESSETATEHETEVEATYLAYTFASSPRLVAMDTSHTEAFVMIDSDPPTSAASTLPTYRNALTFDVNYTASDGSGSGLDTVTLWYRLDGAGWTPFATQPAASSGTFTFTGPSDGVYEFATTADDVAGNTEPGPGANDTWTIVDTVRPGSAVAALPTYETTASFLVSWAPDGGVADIVSYTIQYNRGTGWLDWLVGTSVTSAMFTASPAFGVYQFRSLATDAAGNVEVPPAGNDTWTLVDTERPTSAVAGLPTYETSLTFIVSWGPTGDSLDIATYRIEVNDNGGGWTAWIPSTVNTSASYTGVDGHLYQFRSIATDRAGNVETAPAGNDTWTRVDVTPPDSRATALAPYYTTLSFPVAWGPVAGTTDITTYTLEVSDNGGAWTAVAGSVNTAATSATFVGVDGHSYAFRTLARDRAGNLEPAPSGNDTWTRVDVTRPFAVSGSPRGANVNATPLIVITFSEPMDRTSVEQAFSLSPDMNGAFSWSPDSRTVTFTPERGLNPATRYVVAIDSSARDLAGNTATGLYTFDFTTSAAPFGILDMWWVFAAIAVAVGGSLFFVLMRRRAPAAGPRAASVGKPAGAAPAPPAAEATIDDVFLLYRDGVLIKHETRRLKPDIDTDILSGMLTAVQQFVKDSFRTEEGELDELTFGQMHILIGRGKYLILAAMIQGDGTESFTAQIKKTVQDIEDHHWDQLEDWDGDMAIAKILTPYVKKLIRGDYL
jgi:hypothetical protein